MNAFEFEHLVSATGLSLAQAASVVEAMYRDKIRYRRFGEDWNVYSPTQITLREYLLATGFDPSTIVFLYDVDGTAVKSGRDCFNNQWIQFEVDYFAEQEDGECVICSEALSSGYVCLDGGEEVCDDHVIWVSEAE